jgi:hypothetical protein
MIKVAEISKIDTLNTQIHDHSFSWLGTSNTQIHDHSFSWLGTSNTQIHEHSFYWLGTGTSIERGGVKLALWAKTFPRSAIMQVFFHM